MTISTSAQLRIQVEAHQVDLLSAQGELASLSSQVSSAQEALELKKRVLRVIDPQLIREQRTESTSRIYRFAVNLFYNIKTSLYKTFTSLNRQLNEFNAQDEALNGMKGQKTLKEASIVDITERLSQARSSLESALEAERLAAEAAAREAERLAQQARLDEERRFIKANQIVVYQPPKAESSLGRQTMYDDRLLADTLIESDPVLRAAFYTFGVGAQVVGYSYEKASSAASTLSGAASSIWGGIKGLCSSRRRPTEAPKAHAKAEVSASPLPQKEPVLETARPRLIDEVPLAVPKTPVLLSPELPLSLPKGMPLGIVIEGGHEAPKAGRNMAPSVAESVLSDAETLSLDEGSQVGSPLSTLSNDSPRSVDSLASSAGSEASGISIHEVIPEPVRTAQSRFTSEIAKYLMMWGTNDKFAEYVGSHFFPNVTQMSIDNSQAERGIFKIDVTFASKSVLKGAKFLGFNADFEADKKASITIDMLNQTMTFDRKKLQAKTALGAFSLVKLSVPQEGLIAMSGVPETGPMSWVSQSPKDLPPLRFEDFRAVFEGKSYAPLA
jgi:hypothetical protein